MERVILVVVMNTKLQKERQTGGLVQWGGCWLVLLQCAGGSGSRSHQPSLQCDRVDVEVFDQAQVMVHVLQTAQHLEEQRTGQ